MIWKTEGYNGEHAFNYFVDVLASGLYFGNRH